MVCTLAGEQARQHLLASVHTLHSLLQLYSSLLYMQFYQYMLGSLQIQTACSSVLRYIYF